MFDWYNRPIIMVDPWKSRWVTRDPIQAEDGKNLQAEDAATLESEDSE